MTSSQCFEHHSVTARLPVVGDREFQTRAADELDLLPEGAVFAEMVADYSVMQDQARACVIR